MVADKNLRPGRELQGLAMNIVHKESLEFYECELLFEAEDETGRKYIAVHDDELDTGCRYVVVPVNKDYLTDFKAGSTDLRNLMLSCEERVWYTADITVTSSGISLIPQSSTMTEGDVLPERGHYIRRSDISTSARRFAIEKGRPAIAVKMSGTAETDAHEIPYQMLAQLFSRITGSLKQLVLQRNPTASQTTHQLNVVAGPVPGSFEMLLASPGQTDLFSDNHIVAAFEQLTNFINTDFDAEVSIQEIESHNSKTLKEFQRTTQAVISSGTDMMVEWSAGRFGRSGSAALSSEGARKIATKLSEVRRLRTTTIVLEGRLDAINVSNRTWSIITETEGKRSGKVERGGPDLAGRTTGKRYRMTCDETIDEMADDTVKPILVAKYIQELQELADPTGEDNSALPNSSEEQFEFEV